MPRSRPGSRRSLKWSKNSNFYYFIALSFLRCSHARSAAPIALRNIRLTSVKTKVEADLDYTAQFDLGDSPLISEYRVIMDVKGNVIDSQVQDLKEYALRRCMGMFTIRHAIALKAEVRLVQ